MEKITFNHILKDNINSLPIHGGCTSRENTIKYILLYQQCNKFIFAKG